MATYQYLKPENIVEVYKTAKKWTDGLTEKFPENERIARNKPVDTIPKEYPKTTDGTTAAIIRKTPHRVIQQIPTGKVISVTNDWLSVIAEFIYTTEILTNANEDYALLQKCWTVVERMLAFGHCATYAPFVERGGKFTADLRLIYWGDVALQPGKLSDTDANYIFLRSWWQTKDIDALIEKQSKLTETERTWDVEALKAIRTLETTKDEQALTPMERDAQIDTKGGVELITGFQRGVGAKNYTFHIHSTGTGKDIKHEGTIVRTKITKDPRGEMPVSFAYGDVDGSNPLGRSIIDLVGSLQNLMDTEMQMFQYNRALMLNPPLIKRGAFNKNKVKFVPNIVIDVGSDPNAGVEPLTIDTTAIARFPDNYGLMKSQILNLLSNPDTSISADVGNPGFSKVPAGIKQQDANVAVDDNYIRKMFETWFERWSETAINVYFAERSGVEKLQLDKKSAEKLRKLAREGKFDETLLSEDNVVIVNYDSATEALKFEIDASTSKVLDEAKQLESLAGLTNLLDSSPAMQAIVPPEKQLALWNALVTNSAVEDPEELIMSEEEIAQTTQQIQQAKAQEQQAMQQANQPVPQEPPINADHVLKADAQAFQQTMDMEKFEMEKESHAKEMATPIQDPNAPKGKDGKPAKGKAPAKPATPAPQPAPPQPEVPQQISPEDQQVIEALKVFGATDEQIQKALTMLHAGYSVEEIMQMLGLQNG